MIELIHALLDHAESFRWLFFLALLLGFYRWMNSADTNLEWRDFVSTRGPDGIHHGDANKVGQMAGIVAVVFIMILTAPKAYTDFTGFATMLVACLGFLGGVAAYAANLRAKSGRIETTTTVEPAAPAAPAKVTTKSSAPAAVVEEVLKNGEHRP